MDFYERYGPWAIVTGASEGTGRAFARHIAARGISCILIARREEPLRALADEIRAESHAVCVTATIDLSAPDAFDRIVEAVGEREVGLFVNNAGADTNGSPFLDRDVAAWIRLVTLNVMTMMQCCHHYAAPMRKRGRGGLLLVNSGACYGGLRTLAAYTGSKAFMLCFSEALWGELHVHGVDVLTLVLGQTDTPAYRKYLVEKALPFPGNWAAPDQVAKVGLDRLRHGPVHNWGQADDVAGYAPNSPADRRKRIRMIGGE